MRHRWVEFEPPNRKTKATKTPITIIHPKFKLTFIRTRSFKSHPLLIPKVELPSQATHKISQTEFQIEEMEAYYGYLAALNELQPNKLDLTIHFKNNSYAQKFLNHISSISPSPTSSCLPIVSLPT